MIFKDAQNNSLTQRSQVEEFIEQGIDLLIISPKEAAPLTQPVAEAYQRGIPVIVLDREVQGDEYTSFIGADNVLIGREAGRWIREELNGQGTIVELKGLMTSTPGQDRNRGFLEGLDTAEQPRAGRGRSAARWSGSSLTRVRRWSRRWPPRTTIDAVYAHNDPGAHGAWLAARAAGRENEMLFVGIDALPHEGVQYVQQGIHRRDIRLPHGRGGGHRTSAGATRRWRRSRSELSWEPASSRLRTSPAAATQLEGAGEAAHRNLLAGRRSRQTEPAGASQP